MTNRSSGSGAQKRDWRDVHLSASPSHSRHGARSRERERERDNKRRRHGSWSRERSRDTRRSRSRDRTRRSAPKDKEREEGECEEEDGEVVDDVPVQAQPPPPQDPLPDMDLEIPPSPPPIEMTMAERRKRRSEIMAKYQYPTASTPTANGTPNPPPDTPAPSTPNPEGSDAFELAKGDSDEVDGRQEGDIGAADYDPSLDRREDASKRFPVQPQENTNMDVDAEEEVEEIEVEEDDEDVDDMFSITPDPSAAPKIPKKKILKKVVKAKPAVIAADGPLDATEDPEGYYTITLGEVIDSGRYQVYAKVGSGMFAVVVKARVLMAEDGTPFDFHVPKREVAIKIMRKQESMHKSGLREAALLTKLNHSDRDDKKHIVRLERTFEWRGHLCLVLEGLSMNLREILKKFGRDVGLNIGAVRAYACQIFQALSHLKKETVTHADIKPDNILVNSSNTHLKICDLGSAADAESGEPTPYLVSRFYRAPEVILGLPYDPSIDIWSVGCTLFELYTGRILFAGRDNRQMLQLHMEVKGKFNSKLLKKARFAENYFDELGMFLIGDKKLHISTKPSRDLKARLLVGDGVGRRDERIVRDLIDLLEKCLTLDPSRRITPKEALAHPFCRGV